MNIYGYCRISTSKQSIDRQIRNIKAEYPTAHIVQEAYTGTSIFRPEWLKLYRVLKAGDTVVFDSVSRMSRNAEEGFALYEDLYHKGMPSIQKWSDLSLKLPINMVKTVLCNRKSQRYLQ